MKIFLASDHGGFDLKNAVREHLFHTDQEVIDVGPEVLDADDDYPIKAYDVATKILGEEDETRGILICRSGQGMAMAANRLPGIRAALAWDEMSAHASREDDDANVLCLSGDLMDESLALRIVDMWLRTEFSKEPRYARRVKELDDLGG